MCVYIVQHAGYWQYGNDLLFTDVLPRQPLERMLLLPLMSQLGFNVLISPILVLQLLNTSYYKSTGS